MTDEMRGRYGRENIHAPNGLRRITPAMLAADKLATRFAGGEITTGHTLAALKSAPPHFGFSPCVIDAMDWLFRFTKPQDWLPGRRPIVWPSASLQAAELGLTASLVKRLNRYLVELGLVAMRDSPNRKRYGRRDARGRIVEAYGFDLSPIAVRIDELRTVAEICLAECAPVASLRRRATIVCNSLRQTWQTYLERQIVDFAVPGIQAAADPDGPRLINANRLKSWEWFARNAANAHDSNRESLITRGASYDKDQDRRAMIPA